MSILDTLLQKKILSPQQFTEVQQEIAQSGENEEAVLLRSGVSSENLLDAKAEYYGVPVASVGNDTIAYDVLKYVPQESAIYYRFVPLAIRSGVLEIGVVDPDNIEARDAINFIASRANLAFKIFLISEENFNKAMEAYKGMSGQVENALKELDTQPAAPAEEQQATPEIINRDEDVDQSDLAAGAEKSGRIIEDAPVTKIVATIINYASEGAASDIHIEHMGDTVRVRYRVDGILNTSLVLPAKVHSALIARIKILCSMRLDEKRKPQDGRFSAKVNGKKIDFRVSTFPAYYGEKVVMRLLDSERGVISIKDMGLTPRNFRLFNEAIKKPYGLVLISGPTGSGKSTTLYSMLNEVDKEQKNVLSLEDPVEYNIPGMNQSQVRPEIGYTFANGLRTTLRQDPDIIMVGEIRDKETAQLAIQAALTGHLVLSTIHTNNAAGVIPRLVDMGIDPYLIAPTLVLAIAQRLVRKLAPGSGKPIPVDGTVQTMLEKEFLGLPEESKKDIPWANEFVEATPTTESPTGTTGRVAVMEVIEMTDELQRIILKSPTEEQITKIARSQGMFTMREDAIIKAFKKEIPLEEVNGL